MNFKKQKKYIFDAQWTSVALVMLGILVVLLGAMTIYKSGSIESVNLVIAFFGILATFIVVSNYSQVRDIKNDVNRNMLRQEWRMTEHETQQQNHIKTLEQKIDREIETIKNSVSTPSGEPMVPLLKEQFNQLTAKNDGLKLQLENQNKMIQALSYLIDGEHKDLVLSLLQYSGYRCNVTYNKKSYKANAVIYDNKIVFNIEGKPLTADISKVNGKDYSKELMNEYLNTLLNIKKRNNNQVEENTLLPYSQVIN